MNLFVKLTLCTFFVATCFAQFYTTFDPNGEGFTQELYGYAPRTSNIFVGVAFLPNNVLVTNCDGSDAWVFNPTADLLEHNTPLHSATRVTMPYPGCNIINHPDGHLYYAAGGRGIVKLNNNLIEVPIAGQLGGQNQGRSARLGMAVYPKDHNKIFFVSDSTSGIVVLDVTTNTIADYNIPGVTGKFVDGMFFNTAGDLLFLAGLGHNEVWVASIGPSAGTLVHTVSIPSPDGIAFHDCSNSAFVASSNGILYRINGTSFVGQPFGTGAFRGDIGNVGPDGCFYLTYANNFRYNDGTINTAHVSSLVKICNENCGFSTPPGVPEPGGVACGDGTTRQTPFGEVSSLFNVLVFDDFECKYSDTEGRLAAGGTIDLEGYSVGCRIFAEPDSNCINFGDVTCAEIDAANEWADTVVAGQDVNWRHGEVKAGNLVYGTTKALTSVNIVSDCSAKQSSPVDFAEEKAILQTVSNNVKGAASTGTVVANYGSLTLQGTGVDIEVFSLTSTELGSAQGITFADIKSGATVLINVSGKTVTAGNFGFFNAKPAKTLWNFWEATSLAFHNVQWEGSVLAIHADIIEPTGQFNGQVFANSWKGSKTGTCMQQNHVPFEGCVPTDEPGGLPPPPPPNCQEDCVEDLLGATYYNGFFRDGFECRNSDVEGRLASGSHVTIANMGFANCISLDPASPQPCQTYQSCNQLTNHRETLISGGPISSSGSNGVKVGDVVHTGANPPPGVFLNGQNCAFKQQANFIDFNARFVELTELSENLCTLAATGNVVPNVQFVGTGTLDREVFVLSQGFTNTQVSLNTVKSGATVVVNVFGANPSFLNVNFQGFDPRKTIWNFCEATSLSLKGVGWRGTILAPKASISRAQGQIDGQVIAKGWFGLDPQDTNFACMELHEEPFNGCLPVCF